MQPTILSCWMGRLAWATAMAVVSATAAPAQSPGPVAGYASLIADRVEVRREPGADKPVAIVFSRAGLPVAVTRHADGWALIQDSEGAGGWVRAELLSRRRTAQVLAPSSPSADKSVPLRSADRIGNAILAYLEPGVIVGIVSCNGRACYITASGVRGLVDQVSLWGVAEGETIQ
jgi:SH3-like domain-containing protein